MKLLLMWLSVIAFIQVVLIAFGAKAINELVAENQNKLLLYFAIVISVVLAIVTGGLYAKIFSDLKHKQKK